jgi:microcystin degradation protein MlrC
MSRAPRILFAGLFHETHTFVDGRTGMEKFDFLRGEEMLCCRGDASPLGGALEVAGELGWEVAPAVDCRAEPSAMVEDAVFEQFWSDLEPRVRAAMAAGIDGAFLVLHGAMVTESLEDPEGELLRRLRALPGVGSLPVFGVFDLHGHFSDAMAAESDCLVGYRENPHADARQASIRAARLLDRAVRTGERPRQFVLRPGILWPPTGTGTAIDPMRALEARARELELRHPEFWAVSVNAGFAFGDVPDVGVAMSVATSGSEQVARAALDELGRLAHELRKKGCPAEWSVDDAVREAMRHGTGLTVLAEPSDNIGGGAPGDGTGLLRALVAQGATNAAVCLADGAAVTRLKGVAAGSKHMLELGGRGSRLDPGPLRLEVELVRCGPGRFELEDKQSHLASGVGDFFDMGDCAVVRAGGITILLTTKPTPPMDLGQWHSQGIRPAGLSIIGIKAAVAHRRAFDPIAARQMWVNTPGPCMSDLAQLPYRRARRPIWPLDSA